MTSFTLYPYSYSIIPSIHHQNIHRIHLNNSYHHHYIIYLVSRSTHLGTRSPLYLLLYSTSFISMTSFTLYPHSHSVISSIHHQNIHLIHQNNSCIMTIISFILFQDATHLGTRSPLYIILYSTSFISMTSFTLYPYSIYSYSIIPSIYHQNIHRIHLNNSYHHHYIIYLVSRSTHLGTRSPLYLHTLFNIIHFNDIISLYIHTHGQYHSIHSSPKQFTAFTWITRIITIISFILFQDLQILEQDLHSISYFTSTSFISMTSFPLYSHSYSIIPSIHHQNIHRIHLNNSYHHHYLIYLVSRSTHLGTRSPLYIILYSTSFISMTSFTLYPYTHTGYHSDPFITKTFTAFTWITRIITIISFILFQDLHILEQDLHCISYFIQHHSFQWHHSLYIHTHTVSFHPFITKTFTAFTWITRIITIISFILFQDLHILEQDLHSICYFIQHHSFQWHHSLYIHTHTVSFHPFITKTFTAFTWITCIITIISFILFQDATHLGTRSPLYLHTLFNIIHFNDIIHSISTLIQYHSIHSSTKHSPHSPE